MSVKHYGFVFGRPIGFSAATPGKSILRAARTSVSGVARASFWTACGTALSFRPSGLVLIEGEFMAEKAAPRRRSAVAVKQEMQATLAEAQKEVQERREASATPEQRIAERNIAQAVEAADALFADGS
jgi:hypothetical protein